MTEPERGRRALRHLELMRHLVREGAWCSYRELEESFAVGWRTVYRDMELLRAAGVPIEHDDDEGRGWRLRKKPLLEWMFSV